MIRTPLLVAATAATLALAGALVAAWANADDPTPNHHRGDECASGRLGERYNRTELFFGLSRADGPPITDEQFDAFVDAEVTPWFPDGLTLVEADGQFRDSSGTIIEEESRRLILLYGHRERRASRRIEKIRQLYKDRFQQQSVLRADDVSCVSF